MLKRIIAIAVIFVCATAAWLILGATIFQRTYSSDDSLADHVVTNWGAPHNQSPPTAAVVLKHQLETTENGKKQVTIQEETVRLPLEGSRINVALDLAHRQKGLLWYSTYKVDFAGTYTFRNTSDEEQVNFSLNFPAARAIYDDLQFSVDDAPVTLTNGQGTTSGTARVAPGQTATLKIAYRSQGLTDWRYNFGGDVAQVRDFDLRLRTNFKDVDFPDTLSPTEKQETGDGWEFAWNYKNLVSGYQIGVRMPEKLQPGPLAGRISLFAPVSLFFFFFFLMFIITTMRGLELHPMNYFFLATAFFSFHLLLAYLVDHVSIHTAFAISSVVSIFLVVSYLRLVLGTRFATREAAVAQFIYLVLFSYAFFFKGFTGLAVTIGSILTLFVVMQITGRVRWAEKFAASKPGSPVAATPPPVTSSP